MDEKSLYLKVKDIVYAVPDELYKYSKPDQYWDDEDWANIPPLEKGFILIKELIENADIDEYDKNKVEEKKKEYSNINILNLGNGPNFLSQADENMFFNAIYSLASFIELKGSGKDLYLYYRGVMSNEEKLFLTNLLKRYQMKIPKDLIAEIE